MICPNPFQPNRVKAEKTIRIRRCCPQRLLSLLYCKPLVRRIQLERKFSILQHPAMEFLSPIDNHFGFCRRVSVCERNLVRIGGILRNHHGLFKSFPICFLTIRSPRSIAGHIIDISTNGSIQIVHNRNGNRINRAVIGHSVDRLTGIGFFQPEMIRIPRIVSSKIQKDTAFAGGRCRLRNCHKFILLVIKLKSIPCRILFLSGIAAHAFVNQDHGFCGTGRRVLVVHGHIHVEMSGNNRILISLNILNLQASIHIRIAHRNVKIADRLVVGNASHTAVNFGQPERIDTSLVKSQPANDICERKFVKIRLRDVDFLPIFVGRFHPFIYHLGLTCKQPGVGICHLILQAESKLISLLPVSALQDLNTVYRQKRTVRRLGRIGIGIFNSIRPRFQGTLLYRSILGRKSRHGLFCNGNLIPNPQSGDANRIPRSCLNGNAAAGIRGHFTQRGLHGFSRIFRSKIHCKIKTESLWDRIAVTEGVDNLFANHQLRLV